MRGDVPVPWLDLAVTELPIELLPDDEVPALRDLQMSDERLFRVLTEAPCRKNITNTYRRSYFASAARERRSPHCVALPARERYDRNGAVCRPAGSGGVGGSLPLMHAPWRHARAMSSGFTTTAGRSRRFGPDPRPAFSGDCHPASRAIRQERRST